MKKSTMLASLFATFAVTATAGVGGMLTNTANADIGGLGTFKIEDGASVRITATEDIKDGLRFQVKMDATTVAKIVNATSVYGVDGTDADNAYKLYAVIAPADVVSGGDFTKVDRKNWVEIDENKIYYSEENSCYYANAVLTNVKEWNRYRAFTMGAVIENGTSSVWADPANEGYRYRSLYQTVNLASLSATENTANIINNADTTYKNWFGKDGYPIMVTTEDQLSSMITDVTSEAYSFADKMIYVDGAVKATDTYATAVADGGALNAIASELGATYYDVTFKADEDTTLYTYKAKSGATAVYNGWTFSKPADGLNNTYTNQGWDESLGAVNANVSYTAEYKAVATDVDNGLDLAAFKNVYWEKATIDGVEKTTLRLENLSSDRNDVLLLSTGDYAWGEGKALTFNVYNNSTAYEYTFTVDMVGVDGNDYSVYSTSDKTFCTVEPNQTQTFTIYAEDFDYSTTKYVRIAVSHYSTAAAQSFSTLPQGAEDGSDFAGFDISLYDFTFGDKAKPTTQDYLDAAQKSNGSFIFGTNSNKNFVCEGDYSLFASIAATWPSSVIDAVRNYDLTEATAFSFQVYNPYTSDFSAHFDLTDGESATASKLCGKTVILKAGEWTTVAFDFSKVDVKAGSGLYLSAGWSNYPNATEDGTTYTGGNNIKWRSYRFYIDAFEISEEAPIELYTTFMNTGAEKKTINGVEKTVLTVAGYPLPNAVGNNDYYPYAIFPMEYEWANGKALTFTVYNNSDTYAFTFDYYMCAAATESFQGTNNPTALIGYATVEPNDTQTITIYAEDFDFNTYKYLAVHTSHYIMTSGQTDSGAQDEVGKGNLDLKAFNLSFYDFTLEEKVKPTTVDYIQATQVSGDCNETLNTNKKYVKDGDYSFGLTNSGNWCVTNIDFMKEYDWSKIDSVTFYVYNPTTYTYKLNLYLNNGAGTAVVNQEGVVLTTGDWKEITFANLKGSMAAGSYVSFSTNYTLMSNVSGAANTAPNRAFRIYLDGFSVVEGDFSADDLLWTQGTGVTFSTVEDTNYIVDGTYSANLKFVGTWETAYFTHATTIDWTKVSKLTFQVYNPNSFNVVFGVGDWATHVAYMGTWTTIEITDFSKAIVADKGLMVRAGHTCSVTVDGVEYTNPTKNDTEVDGWQDEFWLKGLYFDNFVVSYK